MEAKFVHNGVKKVVEKVLGRRKLKKGYEYEVAWKDMTSDANSWLTRDVLESAGYGKLVNEVDAAEAARLGLMTRALTAANVQKQLEDLGLEAEFGSHSQIRGLSGGQKVKVSSSHEGAFLPACLSCLLPYYAAFCSHSAILWCSMLIAARWTTC